MRTREGADLRACWWCNERSENIREVDVGEAHHPMCGRCYIALMALRKRQQSGRGVG